MTLDGNLRPVSLADRRALAPSHPCPFPFLLLPHVWSSRNRARRPESGDLLRASLFGGVGVVVFVALFRAAYWLTTQLCAYEVRDYLLRLGAVVAVPHVPRLSGVQRGRPSLSTSSSPTTFGC